MKNATNAGKTANEKSVAGAEDEGANGAASAAAAAANAARVTGVEQKLVDF